MGVGGFHRGGAPCQAAQVAPAVEADQVFHRRSLRFFQRRVDAVEAVLRLESGVLVDAPGRRERRGDAALCGRRVDLRRSVRRPTRENHRRPRKGLGLARLSRLWRGKGLRRRPQVHCDAHRTPRRFRAVGAVAGRRVLDRNAAGKGRLRPRLRDEAGRLRRRQAAQGARCAPQARRAGPVRVSGAAGGKRPAQGRCRGRRFAGHRLIRAVAFALRGFRPARERGADVLCAAAVPKDGGEGQTEEED
mmetsp:Transcript_25624/g.86104  ORF Transcript_25624/g.86104 Transcript_25624/m.86104 type:complete len:247 (+) Transcript_25624:1932-2672(+)